MCQDFYKGKETANLPLSKAKVLLWLHKLLCASTL